MENEEHRRSKVVKVKQSFEWYVVFDYLQLLTGCLEAMSDKEFNKKFTDILEYASNKISLPFEGNIKQMYVVVEQEATDIEYENWSEDSNFQP